MKSAEMKTVPISIPDELIEIYSSVEQLRKTVIENFVAGEYEKGNISIRQGAAVLGLTYEEFMINFLGKRKMSFINGSIRELGAETVQEEAWLDEAIMESRS
ncbi:MAG: hypothetical protein D3916_13560 [Candidatus Electrothrix sp. MAN1_4]|nr:hypothetical protein [Candidatus Electrothrix sp. MAN1_4]